MVTVKVRIEKGQLPKYMSEHAAGADVCASNVEPIVIASGGTALVPTGLFLEIPPGFEVQVRPRSGLASRHGVTILNAPGTIDADYRGELKVLLINHGPQPYAVQPGERVAQLVVAKVEKADFQAVSELRDSQRGQGGFGSTGQH